MNARALKCGHSSLAFKAMCHVSQSVQVQWQYACTTAGLTATGFIIRDRLTSLLLRPRTENHRRLDVLPVLCFKPH
jgi:hypothetical protein